MPGGCSIRAIWILNSLDAVVFSRYPLNPPSECAHMHTYQLTPKRFCLKLFCLRFFIEFKNLHSEIRPSLPVIFLTHLIRRRICEYREGSSSRLVDFSFPCTLGFSFLLIWNRCLHLQNLLCSNLFKKSEFLHLKSHFLGNQTCSKKWKQNFVFKSQNWKFF